MTCAFRWTAFALGLVGLLSCAPAPLENEIRALRVPSGSALNDPDAPFWRRAPETRVTLLPQILVPPTKPDAAVKELRVRAVHDGQILALRLEWADPTRDVVTVVDRFADQVAVQFPLDPAAEPLPSPMMGHQGAPVRILQWRASLQDELEGGTPTLRDLYPNAVVDLYPDRLLSGEERIPYSGARAVGNPIARPRLLSPVVTHVAEGFGSLTAAGDQPAGGKGRWGRGRWRVALSHPLAAPHSGLALPLGGRVPVCFAVWEGGNNEVGSRKAWSDWIPILLPE